MSKNAPPRSNPGSQQDRFAEAKRMLASGASHREVARALSMDRETIRKRFGPGTGRPGPVPTRGPNLSESVSSRIPKNAIRDEVSSSTRTLAVEASETIRTLDQLLKACDVDLTKWRVVRHTVNTWGTPDRMYGQVKATLEPLVLETSVAAVGEKILEDIRTASRAANKGVSKLPKAPRGEKRMHMLEIAPVDLHLGKYAWAPEAGDAYNLAVATRRFKMAIEDLLSRALNFGVERIALVIGNDLLHVDGPGGATTAGTQMDANGRHIEMFRTAIALNTWALNRCAEIAPTVGIVVSGNHDRLSSLMVGEVLSARFDGHKRVSINDAPTARKYIQYGTSLLGFTHGDQEKAADLPLIMANERPDLWADTTHREWHIGHHHRAREARFTAGDTFNGVRVRTLPSLSSADAWHAMRGYVGGAPACEAYLWHRENGYAGHLSWSP